jgi:hypothetical protein
LPETLIERGIGETRIVTIARGEIVAARILLDGVEQAGTRLSAVLKTTGTPAVAAVGRQDYLLPKGAPGITQGATFEIEVTREAIPGPEPWKLPLARLGEGTGAPPAAGKIIAFPAAQDQLAGAGWKDLLDEARTGVISFAGGELQVSTTPAMTLVDVDGHLPPGDLALAAAAASGRLIRRHGVGGSIGIDFPTVAGKPLRQAIGSALDAALPAPFERTAVNGFGFLQIVRPRQHASLFELAADRAAFEARALLRQAAVAGAGAKQLIAHPAVISLLERKGDWLTELQKQVGGAVTLRSNPALPISGGDVQG